MLNYLYRRSTALIGLTALAGIVQIQAVTALSQDRISKIIRDFFSNSTSIAQQELKQIIFTESFPEVKVGDSSSFELKYTTSDNNPNLIGLGLRVHYNSKILSNVNLSNVLSNAFIQQQNQEDTKDYDNDPNTDRLILIAWADINGKWPGNIPVTLCTFNYTTDNSFTSTTVNFTTSSTTARYKLEAASVQIGAENSPMPPNETQIPSSNSPKKPSNDRRKPEKTPKPSTEKNPIPWLERILLP